MSGYCIQLVYLCKWKLFYTPDIKASLLLYIYLKTEQFKYSWLQWQANYIIKKLVFMWEIGIMAG